MDALIQGTIYTILLIVLVYILYDNPVRRKIIKLYYTLRYK
jgi:hypothetical protein